MTIPLDLEGNKSATPRTFLCRLHEASVADRVPMSCVSRVVVLLYSISDHVLQLGVICKASYIQQGLQEEMTMTTAVTEPNKCKLCSEIAVYDYLDCSRRGFCVLYDGSIVPCRGLCAS